MENVKNININFYIKNDLDDTKYNIDFQFLYNVNIMQQKLIQTKAY